MSGADERTTHERPQARLERMLPRPVSYQIAHTTCIALSREMT